MANLTFGDFTWPNDPESYRMRFSRDYSMEPSGDLWTLEPGARLGRSFECEGVFYGANAYSYFSTLASLMIGGEIQTLSHPKWNSVQALLVKLEVLEEPRENFLRYEAVFLEAPPT